jgi:predicted amidohydrolase YtcJ
MVAIGAPSDGVRTRRRSGWHPAPMPHRIDRAADLVLLGGRIETMDRARPRVTALAAGDGRIAAVGSDAAVRPWIGPRTRVIDLRGRTVTPGFGDAHVHVVSAGIERRRCDLSGLRGIDRYLEAVVAYGAAHPDEAWIVGAGWSMADFPGGIPSGVDLDRIMPDRPVYLESRDGHTAWVNSRGLEIAGITSTTVDPAAGRIERDADGHPSGALQENARELVYRLFPPPTHDELVEALRVGQRIVHEFGITSWQEAYVAADEGDIAFPALAAHGELTGRVVGALGWDETRGLEQVEELVERRARTAVARYAPTSVKFFADGVIENFTAAMLDPYLDGAGNVTADRGMSVLDPAAFADAVAAVDAAGFQTHVHAIGDRAVRDSLDAIEVAGRRNGPSRHRPHIAHIQVIHPHDIGRFRELGVAANAQALWAVLEEQMELLTLPFLGPERAAWQYPFGSLVRAGARLAMGSDWGVSTCDPLAQIDVAVNRISPEHRGQKPAFLPEQRIPLETALEAFTLGSAWVNRLEDEVGSVEVGKTADLAVLDRDLFDRGAGEIADARVIATFIDGGAVFERPELEG